jgi:hypothetical protein
MRLSYLFLFTPINVKNTWIYAFSPTYVFIAWCQSQSHFATDSLSVCLGVEPRLRLITRYSF